MKNQVIYNKGADTVEIDLIGDFGDSWFFDDISKGLIVDFLNNNEKSDIVANLNSLGGDVDTALLTHDYVQKHKGHTTANLYGRNASSSTVFAAAFDKVKMSDDGLFLIHNVWGSAVGNADEMREIADGMDKHNEVIVNIYRKKTGKTAKEIKDLMNAAKWYTAKEAKELGFIDEIIKSDKNKVQNKVNSIYNKYLPTLKTENMADNTDGMVIEDEKSFFDKLKNMVKPEVKDISDETRTEFENKLKEATDKEVIATIENTELKNKVSEFDAKETELNGAISNLTTENDTYKAKIEALETELAQSKAEATVVNNDQDVNGKEISEEDQGWIDTAKKMQD